MTLNKKVGTVNAAKKKPRKKKCKAPGCGEMFRPWSTTQQVCSPKCAIAIAPAIGKARQKREDKIRKEQLKTKSEWLSETQVEFNKFIRARDKHKPCISCGTEHAAQWDAGHYLTVGGHPELRFDEDNCHKQCSSCNNYLSGNIARYRINLIDRIGLAGVERLEGPQDPKHYTIDQIRDLKIEYREKTKLALQKAAFIESFRKSL